MPPFNPAPADDAAPPLGGAPSSRVRVRDALRGLVTGGNWPFPSWIVLQNRVLDEVGSDLRPLVALLVRAGEAGLLEQMPTSRAAWPAVRGALVLSLTAHSFLQPEMARWAVECWGYALGVAAEGDLTVAADPRAAVPAPTRVVPNAPPNPPTAPAVPPAGAAWPIGAPPPRAPVPARPGAPPVRSMPNTMPSVAAGRAAAGRVAAAQAPRPAAAWLATPPARARRRGLLPEGLNNPVAGTSLAGLALFAGYVVYSAARLPTARAIETLPVAVPAAPGLSAGAVAAPAASGIPGVTANGLPQTAADSSRMIRVVPARRPTWALEQGARADVAGAFGASSEPAGGRPRPADVGVPVVGAPVVGAPVVGAPVVAAPVIAAPVIAAPVIAAPVAPGAAAPTPGAAAARAAAGGADGFDRLRLRDGRVMRGRVELVRVAAVVFRDADTGLRYEYPKADVDVVVTEFGSTVRFSPGDARPAAAASPARAGATPAERAAALLVRHGVGGRYLVRFSVESVNGSPECRRGWSAAPPPDWARVTHVPGADTLAVTFEGGSTFASVIDEQAQFASTFVIVPDQAYSGSALTTRLSGRFAAGGFDAAVNLVGYRRVREGRDVACHTVLRAVGRLAGR